MATPHKRPAAGAAGDDAEARDNTRTIPQTTPRAQWRIEVVNPIDGKPRFWDAYAERSRAESVAATLRKHGFFAQVRRIDDDPEHRGDRRRFLVWAIMAGFAKPERLTERIVAEIEESAP